MNLEWQPTEPDTDGVVEPVSPLVPVARRTGRIGTRLKVLATLVLGGIGGAAIVGPLTANAASPAPTTVTTLSATNGTGTGGTTDPNHPAGPGGFGHVEAVTDTSVAATAIGISEADLKTALASGQTIAAVAKAHSVNIQVVIDALVADSKSELAAAVKAGTITQAQADAQSANLVQRATDQVNGTFGGGRGPGGPGFGGHNEAVSDTSVIAKAIGISEADLTTALASGQTVAAVAKANNVNVQVAIDALVADSQSELAAAVKAGTITQAQADAMKANLVQHATDQVNGTFGGPHT